MRLYVIESVNEGNDTREERYLIIEYHVCNSQYPNTYTNFTSNPSPVTISCSSALSRNSASTSSNVSSKVSFPLSSVSIECSSFRKTRRIFDEVDAFTHLVLRSGVRNALFGIPFFFLFYISRTMFLRFSSL